MMSGRNRLPFTATQWQELEHQALIFKYMVSGIPIPPDLLFTVKRSLDSSSSLSSNLFLHHPHPHQHIGWNCLQMGFGRKIDPEPGRCRRTDGKKWRCSKEAYPDSKYCERHMHRGRNRSRKPVEVLTTTTTTNPSKTSIPISSISKNSIPSSHSLSSSLSSMASDTLLHHHHNHHPGYSSTHLHHSFFHPHSSPSRPPGIDLSAQANNTTHLLFDSGLSSNPDKDYRYVCGMKEEVMRNHSGSLMDDHCLKQRTCSVSQSGHPFLQLQGLSDSSKQQKQDYEMFLKTERDDKPKKVMHHFLDEWPKNRGSWLDSEDKSSNYVPISTTQLSISIPNSSHHGFFMGHNGN